MTPTIGHQSNQRPEEKQLEPTTKTTFGQEVDKNNVNSENLAIECNSQTMYGTCNQYLLTNYFIIDNKYHWVELNGKEISWKRAKKSILNHISSTIGSYQDEDFVISQNQCDHQILPCQDIIQISKGDSIQASINNAKRQHNMSSFHTTASFNFSDTMQTIPPIVQQYLTIYYAKRLIKSCNDCNRWRIYHLTLYHENPQIIQSWYEQLRKIYLQSSKRLRRIMVFINPLGGRRQGLQIYEKWCKPIVELAGIDASCVITQRANQIRDILMIHDLSTYDAVCCVGGDGTIAELINGLLYRAILDEKIDLRNPKYIPQPRLPIGIIPAGSTDTIVYSLHGTADVQTAAIHLVLGLSRGLDVCSVSNQSGLIRFCTSIMGYGYLGDVAATSEKYRWMGGKRYEYTGIKAFLANRGYEAEIHLLCDNDDNKQTMESFSKTVKNNVNVCGVNCEECSNSNDFSKEKVNSFNKEINPEMELENQQWHIIKGKFFMISGSNISCACTRSPNGIAKYCHSGDGFIHVVLVRKTRLLNNLKFVKETMGRSGDIRTLPFIEIYRTRQCIFKCRPDLKEIRESVRGSTQPIVENIMETENANIIDSDSLNSSWNCDGEVISDLEITMRCHRQLVQVLMRGPYNHNISQQSHFCDNAKSWMNCFNCCTK